jgi:hypothetical protein
VTARAALFALGLALASAPRLAAASPAYSTQLAQRVGVQTEPGCGVCHASDPAVDPVTLAPFGQALRARGFADSSTLIAAFDQMATEKVDSDGDKAIDTDEIGWGGDPNSHDGVKGDPVPEVEQGFCGVSRAPGAAPAGAAVATALALAALAGRRQKRGLGTPPESGQFRVVGPLAEPDVRVWTTVEPLAGAPRRGTKITRPLPWARLQARRHHRTLGFGSETGRSHWFDDGSRPPPGPGQGSDDGGRPENVVEP